MPEHDDAARRAVEDRSGQEWSLLEEAAAVRVVDLERARPGRDQAGAVEQHGLQPLRVERHPAHDLAVVVDNDLLTLATKRETRTVDRFRVLVSRQLAPPHVAARLGDAHV